MRDINLGRDPRDEIPAAVGMEGEDMYEMFRLLALARYEERYVIPTAHAEQAHALAELATECSVPEALLRLVAEGPPREEVGLEPYPTDPRLNPPQPVDTTAVLGTTIPVGAPR